VFEKKDFKTMGILRDITENGVGIRGLKAAVGETKTFVIVPTDFLDIDPLIFDGQCRWMRSRRNGQHLSGFEITSISGPSLQELRRFIRFIQEHGEEGGKSETTPD
jgi:hypothetical protein